MCLFRYLARCFFVYFLKSYLVDGRYNIFGQRVPECYWPVYKGTFTYIRSWSREAYVTGDWSSCAVTLCLSCMSSRVPDEPFYFGQPATFSDQILMPMARLLGSIITKEWITDLIIAGVIKAEHFLVILIPPPIFNNNIVFRPGEWAINSYAQKF